MAKVIFWLSVGSINMTIGLVLIIDTMSHTRK